MYILKFLLFSFICYFSTEAFSLFKWEAYKCSKLNFSYMIVLDLMNRKNPKTLRKIPCPFFTVKTHNGRCSYILKKKRKKPE